MHFWFAQTRNVLQSCFVFWSLGSPVDVFAGLLAPPGHQHFDRYVDQSPCRPRQQYDPGDHAVACSPPPQALPMVFKLQGSSKTTALGKKSLLWGRAGGPMWLMTGQGFEARKGSEVQAWYSSSGISEIPQKPFIQPTVPAPSFSTPSSAKALGGRGRLKEASEDVKCKEGSHQPRRRREDVGRGQLSPGFFFQQYSFCQSITWQNTSQLLSCKMIPQQKECCWKGAPPDNWALTYLKNITKICISSIICTVPMRKQSVYFDLSLA